METGLFIGLGLLLAFGVGHILNRYLRVGLMNKSTLFVKKISNAHREILVKNFRFYGHLPDKSKQLFERRVAKFITLKNFVPRNFEKVTEEMKVLIAASAIQLTFGFPQVFLSYFKNIIIFPDQFYSHAGKNYHKGEVNPKVKAIVLSWKHFSEGYASSEGVNLGLHEMAHALQLENIVMNREYNFLHQDAINQWQLLAENEIAKIKAGSAPIFREYGSTNVDEFFAVAVELFFERPKDFMNYSAELYKALANLLKQDPIRLYDRL